MKFDWTPDCIAELGTMYDKDLAKKLGVVEETVRKKRRALGVPSFRLAAAKRGAVDKLVGRLSDVEIAKRCNVSAALVRRRRLALGEATGESIEAPPAGYHRHTLAEARAAAEERGGTCISRKFGAVLKWRCGQGHVFEQTAHKVIRRRQWCGRCSGQVKG